MSTASVQTRVLSPQPWPLHGDTLAQCACYSSIEGSHVTSHVSYRLSLPQLGNNNRENNRIKSGNSDSRLPKNAKKPVSDNPRVPKTRHTVVLSISSRDKNSKKVQYSQSFSKNISTSDIQSSEIGTGCGRLDCESPESGTFSAENDNVTPFDDEGVTSVDNDNKKYDDNLPCTTTDRIDMVDTGKSADKNKTHSISPRISISLNDLYTIGANVQYNQDFVRGCMRDWYSESNSMNPLCKTSEGKVTHIDLATGTEFDCKDKIEMYGEPKCIYFDELKIDKENDKENIPSLIIPSVNNHKTYHELNSTVHIMKTSCESNFVNLIPLDANKQNIQSVGNGVDNKLLSEMDSVGRINRKISSESNNASLRSGHKVLGPTTSNEGGSSSSGSSSSNSGSMRGREVSKLIVITSLLI